MVLQKTDADLLTDTGKYTRIRGAAWPAPRRHCHDSSVGGKS